MTDMFEYLNILVKYDPVVDEYQCVDTLVGAPLGRFQFDEGPGWVFVASAGLIMDELKALAAFQEDLQSTVMEE